MHPTLLTVELNRETARHARLDTATKWITRMMSENGTPITTDDLVLVEEVIPPVYSEAVVASMTGRGLLIATTDYSQHVFELAVQGSDRV